MVRKRVVEKTAAIAVEVSVVSDYVRLCFDERIPPEEAFKIIERRLRIAKELKLQPPPGHYVVA